jgi:toxin ParE1/3/4
VLSLVWREKALEQLDTIIDYIREHNEGAAIRLQEAMESCAERLTTHPYSYRPGRVAGTREAVVHPNYLLVYRVHVDRVEIVNVFHARRQYPPGDEV